VYWTWRSTIRCGGRDASASENPYGRDAEIAAGLLVAVRPRIGAYVVGAWLAGIILDLLLVGGYGDVALRDFGLLLGALTLGRLATAHERGQLPS
jgi:hypothetical protein